MTYDQTNPEHPVWDITPPVQPTTPTRPGWSRGKTAAVAAAAVVAAAAATGGIAYAAGNSSGSGTTAQAGANGQLPGGGPGGGVAPSGGAQGGLRGGGPGGGALMNALHGQVVVQSGSSYVTVEIQTGKVTAVSATSITVASTDGYTKTYVIGSSTAVDNGADQVSSIATGHTVSIEATVSGDTGTATQIFDRTLRQPN